MEPSDFLEILNQWSLALSNQITTFRKANKKVYIIALSRKMPRFFDWLAKSIPSTEVRLLLDVIKKEEVEITTEYAIPLIFEESERKNVKVAGIIADDVIIFGATANKVGSIWKAFFQEYPYLLALYRSNQANLIISLENDYSIKMKRTTLTQLKDIIGYISEKILSSSLPVDMEYPLIHLNKPYLEVKNYIMSNIPSNWIKYTVKSQMIENASESLSIVLEDSKKDGYTNDFAKIRLFDKGKDCCLEIIAPSAIKLTDLYSSQLFSRESDDNAVNYNSAWQSIFISYGKDLESLKSRWKTTEKDNRTDESAVYSSFISLLIVWAEYLYSLAAFVKNYDLIVPTDSSCKIDSNDLNLILGKSKALNIKSHLDEIITKKSFIVTYFSQAALPDYVNPRQMRDLYLKNVASALKPGTSVNSNLDLLFNVSHFSSLIISLISKRDRFGHHCFGETYESILHRLNLYHYDDSNVLAKVNEWIDLRIDESRIAPKYEIVMGSDNTPYFRRFFLAGSNKLPVD